MLYSHVTFLLTSLLQPDSERYEDIDDIDDEPGYYDDDMDEDEEYYDDEEEDEDDFPRHVMTFSALFDSVPVAVHTDSLTVAMKSLH